MPRQGGGAGEVVRTAGPEKEGGLMTICSLVEMVKSNKLDVQRAYNSTCRRDRLD